MNKMILSLIAVAGLCGAQLASAQTSNVDQIALEQAAEMDWTAAGFNMKHAEGNDQGQTQPGQQQPQRQNPCHQMNLTDTQKTAIHETLMKAKREAITTGATLKLAKMDYEALLVSTTADAAAADAASAKIMEAKTKLMNNKMAAKNNILFTILTAEQRPTAVKCMKLMHRMMRRHAHGQQGHQQGQHGRQHGGQQNRGQNHGGHAMGDQG